MLKSTSGKRQPVMRRKGKPEKGPSLTVVIGAPVPPPKGMPKPSRARDEEDEMGEDEEEAVTLDALRDEVASLTTRIAALEDGA
jgi:hypothetical protein